MSPRPQNLGRLINASDYIELHWTTGLWSGLGLGLGPMSSHVVRVWARYDALCLNLSSAATFRHHLKSLLFCIVY